MKYLNKLMMLFALALLLFGGSSCSDEGYEEVTGTASQDLWEVIQSRPELSQFAAAIRQQGYDKLLTSSGTYTVLAPVNDYMSSLSAEEIALTPAAQIALFSYNQTALNDRQFLTMSNGKQLILANQNLTTEEVICRNGFLRFAHPSSDLYRPNMDNVYEALFKLADEYEEAAFITSLGGYVMDKEASVQIGIDEVTHQPIYDTVMVYYNPFFEAIPMNDNESQMSLILVDNPTWQALQDKYWPYLKQNSGRFDDQDAAGYSTDLCGALDSAATDLVVRTELVRDLSCTLDDAKPHPSVHNVNRSVYESMFGVELTMDSATVQRVIPVSNGEIQVVSGMMIHLYQNKIKDIYIEAEDYYLSNETYKATLVDSRFRGSRYVKTYGIDSLRMYDRYVVDAEGNRLQTIDGKDSIEHVEAARRTVYNTSQFANAWGGSVFGYQAPLFACDYKIQWRHVIPAQGSGESNYVNPDPLCVDYDKYLENPNYPCGGVVRHIQKMYLSQPGEKPLEYNSSLGVADFVLHATSNNPYSNTYKSYKCMTDYDPEAELSSGVTDEIGNGNGGSKMPPVSWKRMGINAGVGVNDPTFETPLIWCNTAAIEHDADPAVFTSGITGVHQSDKNTFNNKTGKPILVPRDVFRSYYSGTATIFVTGNPFGTVNVRPTATNYLGTSIFLDYIHFIPQIGEDE